MINRIRWEWIVVGRENQPSRDELDLTGAVSILLFERLPESRVDWELYPGQARSDAAADPPQDFRESCRYPRRPSEQHLLPKAIF